MNPAQYKTLLLSQKAELEAALEQAADAAKPVELDQTVQGRVSRIDAIQQQEMVKAAQERRRQQITKIDAALKRIEEDEYGYCLSCGEEIAEQRLELEPAVTLCIKCAP